jgi:hypothetical protein
MDCLQGNKGLRDGLGGDEVEKELVYLGCCKRAFEKYGFHLSKQAR